jgi:hypothetical protein
MFVRSPRSVVLAGFAVGVLVLASAPSAGADETLLTPAGPATLRAVPLGPSLAIALPPSVAVGWTVSVGSGGNGGPVHPQLISGDDRGTVVASGPVVDLPAQPGTYTYAFPPGAGLRSASGEFELAIAQQVGGHAILRSVDLAPEQSAVDVFAPALADDARDVPRTERRSGQRLAVALVTEPDVDQDGLGDKTQDGGDLRIVEARVADHLAGRALVVVRVRNAGATTRDRPALSIPGHGYFPCYHGACGKATPMSPGSEAQLSLWVDTSVGEPTQAVVGAEGVDATPADNTAALAPFVRLTAAPKPVAEAGGLRVTLGIARAGSVRLSARVSGVDFGRTIRFTKADRRTITLTPTHAADRRHLTAALRRPGRLAAVVTADAGGGATGLRLRL